MAYILVGALLPSPCLIPHSLILTLAVPLAELQKVHSETPREHLPRHSVWLCWHSWAHLARPEKDAVAVFASRTDFWHVLKSLAAT